ncbi:MAG: hypothetical protein BWK73_06310 [Thiothrix lacustris]|uniref:Uncharacterized protein n=1 Tax=Thiothrix lacustris TaxID=525917 RepID=A0A1Y1QWM2_9GAMM|nr:MAG: hypothetical protein BWK73_06310 [Thiothrix lacustris]
MKNPAITTTREAFITISKHSRSFSMQVIQDDAVLHNLTCNFLEHGQQLYAAVIAPADDRQRLAQRVVSFLSAHLRISDRLAMQREVLTCIEGCLGKRRMPG